MPIIANTSSGARPVAAFAALLAVVARVVSIVLWPPGADSGDAAMLAAARSHYAAWTAATAAETVAWVAAGCAVLASVTLVTSHCRWLARIGGGVSGASLLTLGLVGGAMNSVTGVLAREPGRDLMVQVQGDLSSPVLNAFVVLIMLGDVMGVVFAVAMVRAGLLRWWFVVASVVAVLAYVFTSEAEDHLVVLASVAPLGLTWVALARLLAAGGLRPRGSGDPRVGSPVAAGSAS
jgi:hypothetical protein